MKKRYSEERNLYALKQAELSETVSEICHKMGVAGQSTHTFSGKDRKLHLMLPEFM